MKVERLREKHGVGLSSSQLPSAIDSVFESGRTSGAFIRNVDAYVVGREVKDTAVLKQTTSSQ